MALTLTTEAEIIRKAGAGASTTITGTSATVVAIGETAEGELIEATRRDWITGYASVNTYVKKMISNAVAARAAFHIARYDRTGFYSNSEWLTLINSLYDEWNNAVKLLSELDANSIKSVTA